MCLFIAQEFLVLIGIIIKLLALIKTSAVIHGSPTFVC